jgi:U3 small nucleolar RNA-associated protein 24
MGVQKRTRKFATVKRIIGQRDARIKKNIVKNEEKNKKKKSDQSNELIREVYATS